MKCLVTADLHYSLKQWDWVLRTAGHFDLVILAGDHLDIASALDTEAQSVVVLKYLVRIGRQVPLLASSGNHDGIDRTAANESVATWLQEACEDGVFVDGDTFERGEWRFALYPWWDGPETQTAVGRQMERDAALPSRRSVWVYHAPPDSYGIVEDHGGKISVRSKVGEGSTFTIELPVHPMTQPTLERQPVNEAR